MQHLTTCDKCNRILNEMDAEIDIPQYELNATIAKALHPVEAARNSQNIFIASASHELRSPLAAIQSCAEIMEASPERDSILKECKRMTGLIQAMLSLAACDAGIWQMDFHETDIDMLLFEIWETFSEKASKKDIRLNLDVEESYPSIRCDKAQITQALGILLDNAISYSPSNTSIELGARVKAKELVLSVTDHGQGIQDSEKEIVFQRFYSGEPSHTDKSHYGLGLSIAQEIMKEDLHYNDDTENPSHNGDGNKARVSFATMSALEDPNRYDNSVTMLCQCRTSDSAFASGNIQISISEIIESPANQAEATQSVICSGNWTFDIELPEAQQAIELLDSSEHCAAKRCFRRWYFDVSVKVWA